MSDNSNHIKTFTAEDIRNYWSGKMSPREMHALEKASLDDPFLADALEGYSAVNNQTATSDIDWLRKNLSAAKKEEKKAVPLFKQSWMRVAAALIIIGGLGTLSYFLLSPSQNKHVAQTNPVLRKEQSIERKEDTIAVTSKETPTFNFSTQAEQKTARLNANRQKDLVAKMDAQKQQPALAPAEQFDAKDISKNEERTFHLPVASDSVNTDKATANNDDLKKEASQSVAATISGRVSGVNVDAAAKKATAQNFAAFNNNISGRITNSKNEPVAGAVIKANNLSNAVVSDQNGYFSLPVPDTTTFQPASVNSVGYMNANVALNAKTQNNIKLEENNMALNEVVVVGYGSQKKKSRPVRAAAVSPVDTLQPTPVDGWEDYYNYVQRSTQSFPDIDGEIVVRFDIDKKGKPNNIVVEKSLTDVADKEAIRIIKEGPGWKANSKKKKVRLTIKF
jgi:hypothetical protein